MRFVLNVTRRALLAIGALLCSEQARAHSLGGEVNDRPTPPIRTFLKEVQTLAQDLPNGVGVRGVLDQFKLWPMNVRLAVCFNNGDQALREVFAQISQRWSAGTSLKFDFENAPGYRTCSANGSADIRVSFDPAEGHWSYIGTDSLQYKDTSLNIGYAKVPTSEIDRKRLEEIILHEVGHAIGFEHEHQSPASKCEEEFDWPKVYDFA